MKKNKKSLKKLSLNKNVVSSLENGQVSGGAKISVQICPIETVYNCPTVSVYYCPIKSINNDCPISTFDNGCLTTPPVSRFDCSALGCPTNVYC